MIRKKRTEITIETDRVVVIRRRGQQPSLWCDSCGQAVVMVTVDEAAMLARVSSRTMYSWVEADWLHFTETPDGLLLVCLSSLSSAALVGGTQNSQ